MEALASAMAQVQPALLSTSVAEQRATWESAASGIPLLEGTEVRVVDVGGVGAEEVVAPGARPDRVVVHLHGGGYAIGSSRTHRAFASRLSSAAGCRVVVPDYRLAPEHPFPAAVEDAVGVLDTLIAEAGSPGSVAVSGDSAGGGLAIAAALGGAERPAAVVCWSPWVDLSSEALATADPPDDPVLTEEWLVARAQEYLGGAPASNPQASPARGPLGGLPPLLAQVGTRELLWPQTVALAEAATRAGASVELEEVPGAVHLWMLWLPDAPESRTSLERAGEFLRSRLER